ncbi:MAG: TlyA family rRNA (cytidine-2'-O)-methyltransferase [Deltaproteobacteria bacterium]|nr:MAG: TlyA family rRNA (cytidine-2'-O)-methyltransferase [Deltaproteobacteria bacterium]
MVRERLDVRVVKAGLAGSRERAKRLIMSGKILVNRVPVDKPGTQVDRDAVIETRGEDIPYVSRGGFKIEKVVRDVLDVTGYVCMDVGASTGGFTDCLLQHGAARVYAVDVGYGQLAWSLRTDPRVIVFERTNIRYFEPEQIPEPVDLVTIDTAFISLKRVLPAVRPFLKTGGQILALIKPQFEVGKDRVGKGGVVKDPALHAAVKEEIRRFAETSLGFACTNTWDSPILGPKGNREFVTLLRLITS